MDVRSLNRSVPHQWNSLESSHRLGWVKSSQPVRGREVAAFLSQLHIVWRHDARSLSANSFYSVFRILKRVSTSILQIAYKTFNIYSSVLLDVCPVVLSVFTSKIMVHCYAAYMSSNPNMSPCFPSSFICFSSSALALSTASIFSGAGATS